MSKNYIGRIAPSPTGLLHLGHARTFWIAHQRAQAANGTLYLRNDDLDPHRSKQQFIDAMIEDLHWLGITWQQPIVNQSERMPLYKAALEKLIAQGDAYECTCTRKDLATSSHAPHEEQDDEPIYPGKCRPSVQSADTFNTCHSERSEEPHSANRGTNTSGSSSSSTTLHKTAVSSGALHEAITSGALHEAVSSGTLHENAGPTASHKNAVILSAASRSCDAESKDPLLSSTHPTTIRFRIPNTEPITFHDANLGSQTFTPQKDFGDFLLWSRDGIPSYQLATTVDDAQMQITEVVRGADLLKSTARQILLQRALGLPTPQYFHCTLVRDANHIRLAKRHDALSLRQLRTEGRTPAEIIAGFSINP